MVVTANSNAPARGLRELSTYELAVDPALGSAYLTGRANAVRREIAGRVSFVLLPAVLLWARWKSYDVRRDRAFSLLPIGVAIPAVLAALLLVLWNARAIEYALNVAPGTSQLLSILVAPGLSLAEYCRERFSRVVVVR
jgi:hypothetical protein